MTATASVRASAVLLIALAASAAANRFEWDAQNGNFTVSAISLTTRTNRWLPGEVASVQIYGSIPTKHIIAGTTKWQLYELFTPQKISAGSSDYFKCTNKGCDPSQAISLSLASPTAVPTSFKISSSFVIPSRSTSGCFTLVVWGEDQDHEPFDFSASIRFNQTASAL